MQPERPQIYGIIGTSLGDSLSPFIFRNLYKTYGIWASYNTFEIKSNKLPEAIKSFKTLHIDGFNVTYPFKEKIINYLDKIDKSALKVGAVNMVVNRNNKLLGYNTDLNGVEDTINHFRIKIHNENIAIIGAGGTARAALNSIVHLDPTMITIINRTSAKSKNLIKSINCGKSVKITTSLPDEPISLLINATSAPKGVTIKTIEVFYKTGLLDNTILFDLNYSDRAINSRLPGIGQQFDGLYMLSSQASHNFKIWHSIQPDTNGIHRKLQKYLEK